MSLKESLSEMCLKRLLLNRLIKSAFFAVIVFCTLSLSVQAIEKKGFIFPAVAEKIVAQTQEGSSVNAMGENVINGTQFTETYAADKEVLRLKRIIDKQKRDIVILQKALTRAHDENILLKKKKSSGYVGGLSGNMYQVRKGDNLWKIAARANIYGDPLKWITIYNANMDRIKDPNMIYPGQLFRIAE